MASDKPPTKSAPPGAQLGSAPPGALSDGASPGAPPSPAPPSSGPSASLIEFLKSETGSAALLLAATIVALVWANSPASDAYDDLWHHHVRIGAFGQGIDLSLVHWVNDALMALFFYVVGLEIRRELAVGELRDRRAAAIPAIAALAGMVVPALIYVAINAGGAGAGGWGIVMATDIAFVLGAIALLGDRVPGGVRVFLLTLAIVDDIGAIIVIATFYTDTIDVTALLIAAALLAGIVASLRYGPPWNGPTYAVAGVLLWVATYESGIHATIAGVAMGLVTAVHPASEAARERGATLRRRLGRGFSPDAAPGSAEAPHTPNERFQHLIHPITAYVVIPIFALANAGVSLDPDVLGTALGSAVTLGVIAGLVVGKAVGISLSSVLAVRTGIGPWPSGMRRAHAFGGATLAGIGFTVSLFVADLAFTDPLLRDEAKIGVLVASLIAAVAGVVALARTARGAAD
jgi:Na+/H+ antiporter NhaA